MHVLPMYYNILHYIYINITVQCMVVLFLCCISLTTDCLVKTCMCIIRLSPCAGESNGGQSADAVLAMKVHG